MQAIIKFKEFKIFFWNLFLSVMNMHVTGISEKSTMDV